MNLKKSDHSHELLFPLLPMDCWSVFSRERKSPDLLVERESIWVMIFLQGNISSSPYCDIYWLQFHNKRWETRSTWNRYSDSEPFWAEHGKKILEFIKPSLILIPITFIWTLLIFSCKYYTEQQFNFLSRSTPPHSNQTLITLKPYLSCHTSSQLLHLRKLGSIMIHHYNAIHSCG